MLTRNIPSDFAYLKSQIAVLQNTPNYDLFSKRQKQIIYLSIYIYLRSLRSQINNWQKFLPAKYNDPYWFSVNFNNQMTCLSATQSVVESKIIFARNADYTESFFVADYTKKPVRNYTQLEALFEKQVTPAIVHIATKPEKKLMPHHQLLYIGKNQNGAHIIWEKVLPGLEFRVTTLRTVFDYYPNQYWGIKQIF